MKEATGELSMTVIVIIAAVAIMVVVGILFTGKNSIGRTWIAEKWGELTGSTEGKERIINGQN